jgi:hypothetical protein
MCKTLLTIVVGASFSFAAFGADQGPVARWMFDEGKGDVAHDVSGRNDGTVHGAAWVRSGDGFALKFDGVDDYVDCGKGEALGITGPMTIEAWLFPESVPDAEPGIAGKSIGSYALTFFRTGGCYWYLSGGGNYVAAPLDLGNWSHVAATFDETTMRLFVNGKEVASKESLCSGVSRGGNFFVGCVADASETFNPESQQTAHFCGTIDDVMLYNRALTEQEIIFDFSREAKEKGVKPLGISLSGKLDLEPFVYSPDRVVVLSINYKGVVPLPEGARMYAELSGTDGPVLQCLPVALDSPDQVAEAIFSLADLPDAAYRLRAVLANDSGVLNEESVSFDVSPPAIAVPAPDEQAAPLLPPPAKPPSYDFELAPGGGFTVAFAGRRFQIGSLYSYPKGGENRLSAGVPDSTGEPSWKVATHKAGTRAYRVHASGPHYLIERTIHLEPSRVLVRDTITNRTDEVIGIIVNNFVDAPEGLDVSATKLLNPSIFLQAQDHGVGLIALDDVYQLQMHTYFDTGRIGIADSNFGLARRATYEIEWAVYPTATNDYYDFINQVRKDEGLNGTTVRGTLTRISMYEMPLPSRESLDLVNAAYLRTGTPWYPIDDPTVSIEGIDFGAYPRECTRLAEFFQKVRQEFPNDKVMFHVAHGLYCTGQPEKLFSDSRVIDADGNQRDYGGGAKDYYLRYFSKERVEQNFRWWLFYPTSDNSFGKSMLKAVDCMLSEMKIDSMFGDGFITGYALGYTYDRWDGHTVDIDPGTKTVTRKMGHVTYMSLPVLKTVARKIKKRGGVLITIDLAAAPRSLWKHDMITACETGGGDNQYLGALHLARTVIGFGNPSLKTEREVYRDILGKLEWGGLYFFYGSQPTHKTLVEHMYPITVESIHAGVVHGKERILTKRSGVYGWHDDCSLHAVFLYDKRGHLAQRNFITTTDKSGVRTHVTLQEDESAAIVKLPVSLQVAGPVNVVVAEYDADGVRLLLNGGGRMEITLTNGVFPIRDHERCTVTIDDESRAELVRKGRLAFEVTGTMDRSKPVAVQINQWRH